MDKPWETLGGRIKWARKRQKLSQSQLAKPFGITRNAVSLWESNDSTPEPEKMADLARQLDVGIVWLWSGKGAPDGELTSEEARLLSMFRALPLDRQTLVLQIVSTMVDREQPEGAIPAHLIPIRRG